MRARLVLSWWFYSINDISNRVFLKFNLVLCWMISWNVSKNFLSLSSSWDVQHFTTFMPVNIGFNFKRYIGGVLIETKWAEKIVGLRRDEILGYARWRPRRHTFLFSNFNLRKKKQWRIRRQFEIKAAVGLILSDGFLFTHEREQGHKR